MLMDGADGPAALGACVRFARQPGYRKITLWTHSNLRGARPLYERNGFRMVSKQSYNKFGCDLVGEI